MLHPEIAAHYERGLERDRLSTGVGRLELLRTQDVLRRHLPPPPASVLDVGGGTGVYASWLAGEGYRVHLVDAVALHVEQALAAADHAFHASVGEARELDVADGSYDALLLLGPIYHLVDRGARLDALAEARRAVRPGGRIVVAAISRFASLLDGLRLDRFGEPAWDDVVRRAVEQGEHSPPPDRDWFTTAYFHRPDELAGEVAAAGLHLDALVSVEGPATLLPEPQLDAWFADPARAGALLDTLRLVESEPSVVGTSAHLLAVATRP